MGNNRFFIIGSSDNSHTCGSRYTLFLLRDSSQSDLRSSCHGTLFGDGCFKCSKVEKIQATHDGNCVIADEGIRRSLPETIIYGKGGDRNGYRSRLQDGSR